jgi:hypothetical protein
MKERRERNCSKSITHTHKRHDENGRASHLPSLKNESRRKKSQIVNRKNEASVTYVYISTDKNLE